MRAVEKRLRERIKFLEEDREKLIADRDGFRAATVGMLKEAIRVHGEGKYWSMPALIETLAKHIARREWWYW